MRYETRNKIMIIVVLLSIMGITIGFAAFTANLTISSNVSVNPNASAFKVVFSKSSTSVDASNITPTVTPTTISASNGVIDNTNSPTLTNLTANFTEPGQKAVYSLYVYNAGEYTAYLNSVTLKGYKSYTPGEGATISLVGKACEDIKVTVKVGSDSYQQTTQNITGKSIEAKGSTPVEVTIEYLSGGDRADGPFSVEFNDISLFYATITGQNEPEEESGAIIIYSNSFYDVYSIGYPPQIDYEFETDVTNIDTDVYLKLEVVNNVVTTSYACATYVENGIRKEVCLKGGDPVYYESNVSTLKGVESYFNTLSSGSDKGFCNFSDSDSGCNSNSFILDAFSDGFVDSNDGSLLCYVDSDGYSQCIEL